ncbi:MAG TPA: hypothetical protein VMD97_12050 [Candidatus Aquilonibacter sp.]|nr:hypothetical protein [Candidatus Aquilonibacter sp.]
MPQVIEKIRLALTSLGRGMAVKVLKVEEEFLFNFVPSAATADAGSKTPSNRSASSGGAVKAEPGYLTWRRPR